MLPPEAPIRPSPSALPHSPSPASSSSEPEAMPAASGLDALVGLLEGRAFVALTGAGLSTESGIPDFRSPGGIWSQSQPVYYDQFLRSQTARNEYWRQKSVAHRDFAAAQPNQGHRVLAQWEAQGRLTGVITQNIDGLHQLAGSRRVLEVHGTAREVSCVGCRRRWPAEWSRRFWRRWRTLRSAPAKRWR